MLEDNPTEKSICFPERLTSTKLATSVLSGTPASPMAWADSTSSALPKSAAIYLKLQEELQGDLGQVEKLIVEATRSRHPQVHSIGERAIAMGGKRLRPILALLASRACSDGTPSAYSAQRSDLHFVAAAIELVHAASLVHDDVMDGASHRRNQATIVDRSGNSIAVLLGDFLFTRAYALAASCSSTFPARQIASAATSLCEGELRQQASVGAWDLPLSEYKSILTQKTAALCEVSCRLGSWCGGGSIEQRRGLTRFGRSLGLAFQIFDDWLDYWGDDRVGKTLGTDFGQQKPTLPVLRLLSSVDPKKRRHLVELLDAGDASAFQRELDASDSSRYTLDVAARCATQAKLHLKHLPKTKSKTFLLAVADYSVQRST